jgi:predicted small metal-binding protein
MAKRIECECGYIFQADTDDELWSKAEAHITSAHPDLVGKVTRDDILAQAKPI